jgi:hypothetical protein
MECLKVGKSTLFANEDPPRADAAAKPRRSVTRREGE